MNRLIQRWTHPRDMTVSIGRRPLVALLPRCDEEIHL